MLEPCELIIISMQTAKAIGIKIPNSILMHADKALE
jgi:hypothetical protein